MQGSPCEKGMYLYRKKTLKAKPTKLDLEQAGIFNLMNYNMLFNFINYNHNSKDYLKMAVSLNSANNLILDNQYGKRFQ